MKTATFFFAFASILQAAQQNLKVVDSIGMDSALMSITCTPTYLRVKEFDTVTATADQAASFIPNTILVRAFTPFPDETDNRVKALFHFDNDLINSAPGGQFGVGAPTFLLNSVFGKGLGVGSFTISPAEPISGDFTIECWIETSIAGQTASIISGSGFFFGKVDGYLTATIGAATITTTNAVDLEVWQHVAVVRMNGSTNLYINGIPMAIAAATTGSITGKLTIGNFTGGFVDDFRISVFARTQTINGKTILQIPTAQNLMWKINSAVSTSPTATLTPEMWQGSPKGRVQFQFSSLSPGPMIINFLDTAKSPAILWSKNGHPVLFKQTPIPVTAFFKDTSHDGHLDLIDIKWTDDIVLDSWALRAGYLAVDTFTITTLDGKIDTLQIEAVDFDSDQANKTIHMILKENTGPLLETGWKDAKLALLDLPITTTGAPFTVTKIIDSAAPIPIFACHALSSSADTLTITFSEAIWADTTITAASLIRLRGGIKSPLLSFNPTAWKRENTMNLVFPFISGQERAIKTNSDQIQKIFVSGPMSPRVSVDSCGFRSYSIIPFKNVNHPGIMITARRDAHFSSGLIIDIRYSLPGAERATVRLYNLQGQMASFPFNQFQNAGPHSMEIQNTSLDPGTYMVAFKAGALHKEKIIAIVK